jgi:hypothetical protein
MGVLGRILLLRLQQAIMFLKGLVVGQEEAETVRLEMQETVGMVEVFHNPLRFT